MSLILLPAVDVVDGVARLAGTQTIAGSTATMDRAMRQLLTERNLPLGTALENRVTLRLHRWGVLDQFQYRVGRYRLDYAWPDRLIGNLPNVYLYAANNPSEGALAKRRGAATLVSYLTPPVASAGLYRGLIELKGSLDRWRGLAPEEMREAEELAVLIQAQAAALDLAPAEPEWSGEERHGRIGKLTEAVLELEYTLIPHGLHVVGEPLSQAERTDMLMAIVDSGSGVRPARAVVEGLVAGLSPEQALRAAGAEPEAGVLAGLAELAAALALRRRLGPHAVPPASPAVRPSSSANAST